jgi:hypothetical protein
MKIMSERKLMPTRAISLFNIYQSTDQVKQ